MPPSVSWLIPVKNGMPYLRETLASIEAQTFRDFEVLVWDNGSTDGTVEELHRWIPHRLPGQVMTGQPLTRSGSRAALVELSQAEFCAKLDADDIATPDRLEIQIPYLRNHPELAAVGAQFHFIDAEGKSLNRTTRFPLTPQDILAEMISVNPIGHSVTTLRRKSVLAIGNYRKVPNDDPAQHEFWEDYDLWLRLITQYQLANLPQVLGHYRFHQRSISQQGSIPRDMLETTASVLASHALPLYGWTPELTLQFHRRQIHFMLPVALALSRHLAPRCSTSSGAILRNPWLLDALWSRTRDFDLLSLLAFCWFDPRPFATAKRVWRKIKRSLPARLIKKTSP